MTRSRRPRKRTRPLLLGLVAATSVAIALVSYATDLFASIELSTVDARFSVRGAQRPPSDIVVVGIDDQTLREVGQPFPRTDDAKVIDRLSRAGAKVIAWDIVYQGPSPGPQRYCRAFDGYAPPADCALVTATIRAGDVVFSATAVNAKGQPNTFGGFDLGLLHASAGHTNVPTDLDGTVRRFFYSWQGIPSFAVAVVERATGTRVSPANFDQSVEGARAAWIDFRGPAGTIPEISYARVLDGKYKRSFFRRKIVVVGSVASALKDVFHTSVGGGALMSGPELNASAIDTVGRGVPLNNGPSALDVAIICLLGLVAPALSVRLSQLQALALSILSAVAFLVAEQLAFDSGVVLSVVYPLLAVMLAAVGSLAVHYFTETRERQRTRMLFSRFVPEDVVDEVLARADDDLRLGGVQRDGTVMFCDLRGFTTFAESLPVARVLDVLNRYLTEMSEAILDHGGTLVAYMGDGIMAVFGAPLEQPDHADRAVAAAREMLGPRLDRVNDHMRSTSLGWAFQMGIGVNSGEVMSGNVGSQRRMEYTAIGDTTNTAARLEAMTKGTAYEVFIADSTRSRLVNPPPDLQYVGEFDVRGRQEKIKLWTLGEPVSGPLLARPGTAPDH